jgi:hypothetical protein
MAKPESHTQCIRHFLTVTIKKLHYMDGFYNSRTNKLAGGGFGSMTKSLSKYHIRSTKKKKKKKKDVPGLPN